MSPGPPRSTDDRRRPASAPGRRWLRLALRSYRALVLGAIVVLIHRYDSWLDREREAPDVSLDDVAALVPAAASLGPADMDSGFRQVLDDQGRTVASVVTTLPEAGHIIGYSGPTDCLVALDPDGRIAGVRILASDDTVEHVNRILQSPGFLRQFTGWNPRLASGRQHGIKAVSGATLTSRAIERAISVRLGGSRESPLFSRQTTLADVSSHFPSAASLDPDPAVPGSHRVLDAERRTIGRVIRTSPVADAVTGYRGPSNSIVFLDPSGKVTGFRVLESFDTPEYVEDLRYDPAFFRVFDGLTIGEVAEIDLREAGIEGVSGATMTSRAVARGIIDRMQSLANQDPGADADPRPGVRDIATIALVLLATAVAFTSWRGRRRLRWALRLLVVGFLGLAAGNLLAQSLFVGWARSGIPWVAAPGLAVLALAALALPLATGRNVYCHHLCPHGAAQEIVGRLSRFRQRSPPLRAARILRAIPALTLAAVVVLALLPVRFNFAAIEPFHAYVVAVAGTTTIVIALAGLAASLFHKLPYCRYGCPTGAVLEFLRSGGSADRFRKRDSVAGVLLVLAFLLYLFRAKVAA